jgi:hypothetical protein
MKLEMQCNPRSVWHDLWWRLCPGEEIVVKWPNGPVIKEFTDQYKTDDQLLSADPNDHYRPYLTKHVGRQGIDWDWRIDNTATDTLRIKIRQRHRAWAAYFAIKWA